MIENNLGFQATKMWNPTWDFDRMRGTPPGISIIKAIIGKDWSLSTYKYAILLITFITYACYHASRKPSSIVESVLYPDPTKGNGLYPDPNKVNVLYPWLIGQVFLKEDLVTSYKKASKKNGWAPFNGEDWTSKLGVGFLWVCLEWDIF